MAENEFQSWFLAHHKSVHDRLDGIGQQLTQLRQEIKTMGTSLSEQMDASNAALSAGLDAIQTDVTAIATELSAAVPSPGSTISQAQVDVLNAQVARVQAVKTSLDALVVPPAAPAS